jgi:hypothetical protein
MSRVARSRAFRLAPLDDAVLGVCLARDGSAGDRWRAMRAGVSMETLEQGKVRRLLPLVGYALGLGHGLDGEGTSEIVGADRDALVAATSRARQECATRVAWLGDVARVLDAADIDVIVLKGVALALTVYPAPELRPMVDADVLVPAPRARDAVAALVEAGWSQKGEFPQHHLRRGQEVDLRGPMDEKLDLHWHLHPVVVVPGAEATCDGAFFARARPLRAAGLAATMLDPTDQLFHVLVHGGAHGWRAHPMWVADAAMLADRGTFDGDRFVAMARSYGVTAPLVAALQLLRNRFDRRPHFLDGEGASIEVEGALDGRLTFRQRRLYAQIGSGTGTKPPASLVRALGPYAETYHFWATQSVTWPRARAAREFPAWLSDYWRLAGPRAIPTKVVRSLGRSVGRTVRTDPTEGHR